MMRVKSYPVFVIFVALLIAGLMPAMVLAAEWSFVSLPDMFNSDIADLSGGTDAAVAALYDSNYASNLIQAAGWPSASGGKNGVTAAMATVYNQLIQEMVTNSGGSPEAFVVAGDLLNGRWFNPNTLNMFDPGGTTFGKLNNAADVYYTWYWELFRQNGIDTIIAAIGDHDIGDNDWGTGSEKANHVDTMKVAFGRNMVDPLNLPATWNGISSTAPEGAGEYDEGSFVIQINNVLFVTIDAFEYEGGSTSLHYRYGAVDGDVSGDIADPCTHLGWLEKILSAADDDPTVDHVIVQAHPPTLPGCRKQASSGMMITKREDSPFWQTLQKHSHQKGGKVRFYFSGEVHTTTASKDPESDIIQLVHGNPPLGNGSGNYVVFRVNKDTIELDLYQFDLDSTGGGTYWQPSSTNSTGCGSMTAGEKTGTMVLDVSGAETTYQTTGWLDIVNPKGLLIHFTFDETYNGNQSNTGDLSNLFYSGAINGDPCTVPGKLGNAMSFDNNGDYYKTAGGLAPISEGQQRSVTGWFKSNYTDVNSSQWETLLGYGQNEINNGEFNVRVAGGTIHLHVDSSTYSYTDNGVSTVYDGQWHHCAVVLPEEHYNNLSDVKFYIDGVEYSGVLNGGTDVPIRTYPGSKSNIHIGTDAENNTGNTRNFNGLIDDVSLWGAVLNAAEINALINAAEEAGLQYAADDMAELFELFDAGEGTVTIGSDVWTTTGNLAGSAGDVVALGSKYGIILDGSGNGVVQICADKPQSDVASAYGVIPDCSVDAYDLAHLALNWLSCGLEPAGACN